MINLKLEITKTNNLGQVSKVSLDEQEILQLREKLNFITQDILDPPFYRLEESKEDNELKYLKNILFGGEV